MPDYGPAYRGNHRGSALIAVVAAIVIFSVMAAALLPMISSSGEQTALSALAEKAYLLSESGYRYAASRHLHPTGPADVWDELGGTYTLNANDGRFELEIDSFYYKVKALTGTNSFTAHAPGGFPDDEIDIDQCVNQKIRVGEESQSFTIQTASLVAGQPGDINITVDRTLPASVIVDTLVLPMVDVATFGTIPVGGDIGYQSGKGAMLPLRNGQINIAGRTLAYRINDLNTNRLIDVRDPADTSATDFTIANTTEPEILLTRYVRIRSTGISGSSEAETRRRVSYYLPLSTTLRYEYKQTFDNPANTDLSAPTGMGDHEITAVEGNNALKVTDAPDGKSLAALDTSVSSKPFNAFRRSSGGYLSYDAQVKTGSLAALEPISFAAGLSFRLRPDSGAFNGYGVSIFESTDGSFSGIPSELTESLTDIQRAIVLWQQTNGGEDLVWLAYKKIMEVPENTTYAFEAELQGWTAATPWVLTADGRPPSSGSFIYFVSANPTSATVTSPQIVLRDDYPKITLSFWTKFETAPILPVEDPKLVRVISPGPVQVDTPVTGPNTLGIWEEREVDLSALAGQAITIQFIFDALKADNTIQSWNVDDVAIVYEWPILDTTLVVRLKEAAVIPFHNGGIDEIVTGDQIFGQSSGASGTVIAPPILSGGNWAGGNAAGTLLLNDVSVGAWFSAGESLQVVGKGPIAAINGSVDETIRRKANVIKVYYASPSGYGIANSSLLDPNTLPYPRLTNSGQNLLWPILEDESLTPSLDFFRLVQWDFVNTAAVPNLSRITSLNEPNSTLLSHHADLQTDAADDLFTAPELGLHALGANATDIYFDDFGFQLFVAADNNFPSAFQQ